MPLKIERTWIRCEQKQYWLSWAEICDRLREARFRMKMGKDQIKIRVDEHGRDWYEWVTWEPVDDGNVDDGNPQSAA